MKPHFLLTRFYSASYYRKLHAQEGFAAGAPSPNKGDVLPGDVGSASESGMPGRSETVSGLECINRN